MFLFIIMHLAYKKWCMIKIIKYNTALQLHMLWNEISYSRITYLTSSNEWTLYSITDCYQYAIGAWIGGTVGVYATFIELFIEIQVFTIQTCPIR